MQKKAFLVAGLFFALSAVLLGAFGAHALQSVLTEAQQNTFETAVRYQMYHALALIVLSVSAKAFHPKKWYWGMILLVAGTGVFSISLYLYVATSLRMFAIITPLGGSALILGWLWLIVGAVKK